MNLVTTGNKLTMSSREIAELTGKQHRNVKRDIENMCSQLNRSDLSSSEYEYRGNIYTEYMLDKEMALCLVSGYSADLRMKIIVRLGEMEKSAEPKLPATFAEALQLAADQAKIIELQRPKVEFVNQLVYKRNLMNATQVAQKIKKSAVWLNKQLAEIGVYNKSVKRGRTFNHWFVEKGYGEMKQTDLGYPQALFSTAGEYWIFEKLTSEGLI